MQFFDDLGRLVEQRWKDKNYGEDAFPEIAAHALGEMDAVGQVDPWEITRHLQAGTELPSQRENEFSDLQITLYNGPRFRIEVYFWLDGTTTIHQHGFSGAFQVLSGSSLHSVYTFREEQEINAHFAAGQVLLKEVQVLKKSDIRKILPGQQFIHSLFHLDRPSATIAVRTNQTPKAQPQYNYLRPHLALDPFFKDYLTVKKIQGAMMLLRMKHPDAYAQIGEIVSTADFHTTFLFLTMAFEHLTNSARQDVPQTHDGREQHQDVPDEWDCFYELLKKAHSRHGELVNLLPPILGEMQRERALIGMRRSVLSNEHRFFLALLLNVPHRAIILDLVKQSFPHRSPLDTVSDWVVELSALQNHGKSVLGTDDFDDNHLVIFRHLLDGRPPEQLPGLLKDLAGTADNRKVEPETLFHSFQKSTLLKSLLFTQSLNLDGAVSLQSGSRMSRAGA